MTMDLHNTPAYTRRAFLTRGLVMASGAATIPYFLQKSAVVLAQAVDPSLSSTPGIPDDRILVVVQLAGGNDGLNTVIPFQMDAYYRNRPQIGVPQDQVLRLSAKQEVGIHPALTGVKSLFDEGMATIIQGVGYPNPNRSHFTSMDIWHTADTDAQGEGWLGRYFDNQCAGAPAGTPGGCSGHDGIAIGREAPLAMHGRAFSPIAFETPELFRWTGLDLHPAMAAPYDEILKGELDPKIEETNPNAVFLTRTAMDAQVASDKIRTATEQRPLTAYPNSGLARQLAMVASMIRAGLKTRVYYVSLGGFDTHAGQGGAQGQHANLLRQLGDAVAAFYADLKAQGNDGRVLTMSFSEFGRRVGQNGSGGTDHGAAAPMFLFGPMVRAGVAGGHPSLTDLDEGDVKFHTDFRQVYATVLEKWLRADARAILGRRFSALDVVRG
jgi:uncharacterized protein (DUF1501 family)